MPVSIRNRLRNNTFIVEKKEKTNIERLSIRSIFPRGSIETDGRQPYSFGRFRRGGEVNLSPKGGRATDLPEIPCADGLERRDYETEIFESSCPRKSHLVTRPTDRRPSVNYKIDFKFDTRGAEIDGIRQCGSESKWVREIRSRAGAPIAGGGVRLQPFPLVPPDIIASTFDRCRRPRFFFIVRTIIFIVC